MHSAGAILGGLAMLRGQPRRPLVIASLATFAPTHADGTPMPMNAAP
jgi:hypothetical protein